MIWALATLAIEPQTVEISSYIGGRDAIAYYKKPALLKTCREAREVAKRYYQLSFSEHLFRNQSVWFNFEKDTILVRDVPSLRAFFLTPFEGGLGERIPSNIDRFLRTACVEKLQFLTVKGDTSAWGDVIDIAARLRLLKKVVLKYLYNVYNFKTRLEDAWREKAAEEGSKQLTPPEIVFVRGI